MTFDEVMLELESLANEKAKKRYVKQGATEPLFGVTTGSMKPLFKQIKMDQALAEELYATGNYDAMYFAGMIADPNAMTEADYDRWMQTAYFPMISDFVVAVTLSEADIAQSVADRWLESENELHRSAAWSCYQWLLGWRPDEDFDVDKIAAMLEKALRVASGETEHVQSTISGFVAAVGVSFLPLHEEALAVAGNMEGVGKDGSCAFPNALATITKAKEKNRLGFKRRAVRC
jgi:3-methyladenine DNA glycosylase AlkD